MLKIFKKNKKNNKGFTLVELVVVVAILAILVGLLAPQYTKYVERARKSTDVSNLENLVKAFEVAAADTDYDVAGADTTYHIAINTNGTTISALNPPSATATSDWKAALKESTGITFEHGVLNSDIKLKSSKWVADGKVVNNVGINAIGAKVEINEAGAVTVTYDPSNIKDTANRK